MNKIKIVSLLSLAVPVATSASLAAASNVLEETIVTAQKREQTLQEVPISVSVIGGQFIAERNIVALANITDFTPNVAIASQTLSFSVVSFRGLSGGFNSGFEQSAGSYVDGVFNGRVAGISNDLGDIARVEILRGPQGTLFGNNSITGTFNIVTNSPNTQEFEGEVGYTIGQEDERRYNLMLTGPISETLSYRFFAGHRELGGYQINDAAALEGADRKMGEVEKQAWRSKLLWQPSDDLDINWSFSGERGESNSALGAEFYTDRPVEDLRTAVFDIPVWPIWQELVPGLVVDRYDRRIAHNTPSENTLDTWATAMTANYSWNEHTLTSITGYSEYRDKQYYDADFSPANFLVQDYDEKYEQFSQELRITSPISDQFEYVAGLYFLSTTIDIDSILTVNFNDYGQNIRNDDIKYFDQDYTSTAAYGQLVYHLSDALSLTGGLRYSYEKKSADIIHTYDNCVFLGATIPTAAACAMLPGVSNNGELFTVDDSRTDDNFSPMVNLAWEINDAWNAYATIATGYKSGGFSAQDGFLGETENQFGPEESLTYEMGAKGEIFDGRGRINVAVFYTEFDDLQVSAFTGTGGFSINNAASATTQGVELDTQFRLTPNLSLIGTLGYTDATYDDYSGAGCSTPQIEAFNGDTDPEKAPFCTQDLSGKELVRAPKWNGSLASRYVLDTQHGFGLRFGLDLIYSDDFFYQTDLDPVDFQKGYVRFDCQIALIDESERWEANLRGYNLSNKDYYSGGSDLPLVSGAHGGALSRERSWALDLKYRF